MPLPSRAFAAFSFVLVAGAADYQAGVARRDITPANSIRLAGYAARTTPSEGVAMPLWAKALAIQDKKGSRTVLITTDLIGLPRTVSDVVAARVQKEHGIERSRLLLNSSHTHAGPIVFKNGGRLATELPDEQKRVVMEYRNTLVEHLVALVGAALQNLTPVEIAYGTGEARFAVNRRSKTPEGVKIGVNPEGPVDHRVPVMRVTRSDGTTMALLFGYACHNTTLTAGNRAVSGDYAGHAQVEVEKEFPGAAAMFLTLCGADQNPNPRGQPEHVAQHGGELAASVVRVGRGKLIRISGPVSAAFAVRDLALAKPFSPPVVYPVQAIRFGKSLTLVALGGEVVVGYALRLQQEFPKARMIVAGYSNDVMAYIPTLQMLKEGGYEPLTSMEYYDLPSPFAPDVEERVMGAVRDVLRRVGVR